MVRDGCCCGLIAEGTSVLRPGERRDFKEIYLVLDLDFRLVGVRCAWRLLTAELLFDDVGH